MKKSLINTMLDDLSLFSFKETSKLKTDIKEYDDYYFDDGLKLNKRIDDKHVVPDSKSNIIFNQRGNQNFIVRQKKNKIPMTMY